MYNIAIIAHLKKKEEGGCRKRRKEGLLRMIVEKNAFGVPQEKILSNII